MQIIFTHPLTKKLCLLSFLILFAVMQAWATLAAAPVISSFSPATGAVGTSVTISGSNFNATASGDIVFFGATMASVTSASTSSLTVTVPAGATYAPITVLNGSNHLSGYSRTPFIVTFLGNGGITTSTFASPQTFNNDSALQFVAVADIDGDGKADIVVVDQFDSTMGVFLNTSSSGSITSASFTAETTLSTGTYPSSIAICDLDGDGKLDVVTANAGNASLSVFRNTSSVGNISFAFRATFSTGFGTQPSFVAIADFDGDGKPDMAVTDEATSNVLLFHNTTTSGSKTISFAAPADFAVGLTPRSIAVGDFDGDGKPDIAAATGGGSYVSILHNTSSYGSISFGTHVNFPVGSYPENLAVSDVDGDGKPDIVTSNNNGSVSILQNTSGSSISFGTHQDINVDVGDPHEPSLTVVMNDLDGDGKPDMIVVDNNNDALYLLRNTSSSGSPSFGTKVTVAVGTNPYTLYWAAVGDFDGDGKPDIVATADGQINVLRNISPPFNVAYSNDASLSNMVYSKGVLNPVFTPGTTSYVNYIPNITTSLTVTPTTNDPNATVTVNGTTVTSGTASTAIPLAVGTNTITTTVTAQDGTTTNSYIVSVIRSPSPNDNLSSLKLTPYTALTVVAGPDYKDYTTTVSNTTASIQVTPTTAVSTSTVTINGAPVASGTASDPISLNIGQNTVTTVVTAEDGSTKTYVITLTRPLSNNANLSSAKLNPTKALTSVTGPDYKDYTASVNNATSSIQMIPTTAVNTSTVTVNGATVASGALSAPIALTVGSNTITVVVTAQDGVTIHTYGITVTRAAAPLNSVFEQVSVSNPNDHPQMMGQEINVHQGISPNGDGINDFLLIDGIASYPNNHLQIMNRSGQLIFEAKGYDNSTKVFDGHSNKNGTMQLPGTYFYQLDYTAKGVTMHKTGFIVIKY